VVVIRRKRRRRRRRMKKHNKNAKKRFVNVSWNVVNSWKQADPPIIDNPTWTYRDNVQHFITLHLRLCRVHPTFLACKRKKTKK